MNICVIGGGGIGSYLIHALDDLRNKNQLGESEITVFDNDGVDISNILYQNFSEDDVFENKAKSLASRYRVKGIGKKITDPKQFKNFDLVVCCVDNSTTRRLMFESLFDSEIDFIDLRSEGKSYAAFSKYGNSLEFLLSTLPEEDVEGGSCQLTSDKNSGIFQQGNKIVALIGSQIVLDRFRGIESKICLRQSL